MQVDVVYTDFSKAFDRVIISYLLLKLEALGFHSSILRWIGSYLSDRVQVVQIGKFISHKFKSTSGVPQGSHLGPILFILMINDLPLLFKHGQILMYADDVKIFNFIQSESDCSQLQSDIDVFSDWCTRNGFSLNPSKCSIMSFYRCKNPIIFQYLLNNSVLPKVSLVKDLGILLDSKLSFIQHYDVVCSKACRMLGFVKRNTSEFKDFLTLKSLYCSLVRSQLEYGSIIWNPSYQVHSDRIERIQKSFTRLALVRYGFAFNELPSYSIRCKLLGLETLSNRRQISSIAFIHDILSGKISCSDLLGLLNFNVPSRSLRFNPLLLVPFHSTNYGQNEPVTRSIVFFNKFSNQFDFHLSREAFLNIIKLAFYFSSD